MPMGTTGYQTCYERRGCLICYDYGGLPDVNALWIYKSLAKLHKLVNEFEHFGIYMQCFSSCLFIAKTGTKHIDVHMYFFPIETQPPGWRVDVSKHTSKIRSTCASVGNINQYYERGKNHGLKPR